MIIIIGKGYIYKYLAGEIYLTSNITRTLRDLTSYNLSLFRFKTIIFFIKSVYAYPEEGLFDRN